MNKSNSKTTNLYKNLRREIAKIQLIDSHEHLFKEEQWIAQNDSLFSVLGYVLTDLISAGMKLDDLTTFFMTNTEDRWKLIHPFWPYVKNMGAGFLCRKALSMFCDVDDLTDASVPHIIDEIKKHMKPGIYQKLFKKYKISAGINVVQFYDIYSTKELKPILYTSEFATVQNRSGLSQIEKTSGQQIYSLKTYLQALDVILENGIKKGLVGIKWHKLAYLRDIDYPIQDEFSAEKCLDRILRMPARFMEIGDTPVGFDEMKPFHNYIQHHLIKRAIDLDLCIQIHTGIHGFSLGSQISYANPTHLVNLFLRYPQARFDLLHVSYPYMREVTALVKLFQNVNINTSWIDILSPKATKQYLSEWITSLPYNKIMGFGGDQFSILLTCAYAEMVRDNLSKILADEVLEGNIKEEQVLDIAEHLLRKNALEYFKLGK